MIYHVNTNPIPERGDTLAFFSSPDPRTDRRDLPELLVWLGMIVVHSLGIVLHAVWFLISGLFRLLWYFLRQIGRVLAFLWRGIAAGIEEHNRPMREIIRDMKHARGKGVARFLREVGRLFISIIFGEHGILRTGFNYVLPVLSILFLIGIIRYGTSLTYAVSVSVDGEELGIIADENDFRNAQKEVMQRVNQAGYHFKRSLEPEYTLRIVSEDEQYVPVQVLADKLLAGTGADLRDAWGVYVDGTFVGAVEDKERISKYLDENLNDYVQELSDNTVSEVYYDKEVTYQEGVYLKDSLTDTDDIIAKLSKESKKESRYIVREGDSPQLVAAMYDMDLDELAELNPDMEERFEPGVILRVRTRHRYIPIAYTKEMTVTSYIDYGTVRVETSALNLGVEQVIAKGRLGKRESQVRVTYVDGIEQSRVTLSSAVTEEPIAEQIGVGTYSAAPQSTNTTLEGSGKYGWPVNGGYISSPFGGERNHKGLDIAAPMDTEIYAAESGTGMRAGWNSGGYGNYVIIEHPDGFLTYYAHCSSVVCYAGQWVERGQLIAYVGSTGDSTGPHCHFEVRENNICQNPADYLRVNAD